MSGPLSCIQPIIVMLPIHVSVFCCGLICSHYLCLFLHAWLSRQGFGDGEGLWDGARVIGWPYFACASITSAECSWMQISLPLWEKAHVSEVINFTLECQLWCWCDVFLIELSHQKGGNLGIWQMMYVCLPMYMVHITAKYRFCLANHMIVPSWDTNASKLTPYKIRCYSKPFLNWVILCPPIQKGSQECIDGQMTCIYNVFTNSVLQVFNFCVFSHNSLNFWLSTWYQKQVQFCVKYKWKRMS